MEKAISNDPRLCLPSVGKHLSFGHNPIQACKPTRPFYDILQRRCDSIRYILTMFLISKTIFICPPFANISKKTNRTREMAFTGSAEEIFYLPTESILKNQALDLLQVRQAFGS